MNGENTQAEGVRALLAETDLSLSDDQVQRLAAGESVELEEGAATRGRCSGVKIFCRKVGPVTCCLFVSFQNGRPRLCVDCS